MNNKPFPPFPLLISSFMHMNTCNKAVVFVSCQLLGVVVVVETAFITFGQLGDSVKKAWLHVETLGAEEAYHLLWKINNVFISLEEAASSSMQRRFFFYRFCPTS